FGVVSVRSHDCESNDWVSTPHFTERSEFTAKPIPFPSLYPVVQGKRPRSCGFGCTPQARFHIANVLQSPTSYILFRPKFFLGARDTTACLAETPKLGWRELIAQVFLVQSLVHTGLL